MEVRNTFYIYILFVALSKMFIYRLFNATKPIHTQKKKFKTEKRDARDVIYNISCGV